MQSYLNGGSWHPIPPSSVAGFNAVGHHLVEGQNCSSKTKTVVFKQESQGFHDIRCMAMFKRACLKHSTKDGLLAHKVTLHLTNHPTSWRQRTETDWRPGLPGTVDLSHPASATKELSSTPAPERKQAAASSKAGAGSLADMKWPLLLIFIDLFDLAGSLTRPRNGRRRWPLRRPWRSPGHLPAAHGDRRGWPRPLGYTRCKLAFRRLKGVGEQDITKHLQVVKFATVCQINMKPDHAHAKVYSVWFTGLLIYLYS